MKVQGLEENDALMQVKELDEIRAKWDAAETKLARARAVIMDHTDPLCSYFELQRIIDMTMRELMGDEYPSWVAYFNENWEKLGHHWPTGRN